MKHMTPYVDGGCLVANFIMGGNTSTGVATLRRDRGDRGASSCVANNFGWTNVFKEEGGMDWNFSDGKRQTDTEKKPSKLLEL